jgi:hypothetical protein
MNHDVTQLLNALEQGDPHAAEELLPLVYDELRRLAAQRMAQERPGQTLQPTALVHEAYEESGDRALDQARYFTASPESTAARWGPSPAEKGTRGSSHTRG